MRFALPAPTALAILALSLPASGRPLGAQTIRGTLLDRDTDRPIATASVLMITESGDSVASAVTNGEGRFVLRSAEPGSFYLGASALGYRKTTAGIFDIEPGGEISLEFRIEPVPISLDEIVVSAPRGVVGEGALIRNGFYQRMTTGMGHFITPEVVGKAQGMQTTDLLFGIPRVTVDIDERGRKLVRMSAPMGQCSPPIYIDGVRVVLGLEGLDGLVSPFVIEAIEVYRGASEVPLQWGGTSANGCGAIVIWTKGG